MRLKSMLLIACCSCGQPPAPPAVQPTVSLPHAQASAPNQLGPDTIEITLTRDGRVAHQGRWLTLNQLRDAIRVEWPAGRDKNVILRCDRGAPWIHAGWLLQICAESNLWRTHFAVRENRDTPGADRDSPRLVECFLPVDRGLCGSAGRPQSSILIRTQVLRSGDQWKFRAGRSPPLDLERLNALVRSILHETREARDIGPVASIQAPGDAPVEAVLALVGTLVDCGAVGFEFASYSGRLPAEHRSTIPLGLPRLPFRIFWRGTEPRIVDLSVVDGVVYWAEEEEETPDDD